MKSHDITDQGVYSRTVLSNGKSWIHVGTVRRPAGKLLTLSIWFRDWNIQNLQKNFCYSALGVDTIKICAVVREL